MNYQEFIDKKSITVAPVGMDVRGLNPQLFDFQRDIVRWALKRGRAAIFADCGMGKTPMQLEWAQKILEQENKPVLIITPLAVSHQTVSEGEKFGIECKRSTGEVFDITVTNYERLHYFKPDDFCAVVLDESSILKSFDGKRKKQITEFMRTIKYRLLCTATAAPNDYTELGTSSEALGELGYMDMLSRFFKNEQGNTIKAMSFQGKQLDDAAKWRLKGHAEVPFWKWVSSWARAIRKPSDYGYDDGDFILPPLSEREHMVEVKALANGMLFNLPAVGLQEQRDERRRSISERCEKVAELVAHDKPVLAWCHLNDEGDELENLIPDAVQVSGGDSDDEKEEKFIGFQSGAIRVLVTKPKIGAWGLNFQHCSHVTFFPSHSFEQYYQGVRRCWRFGQHNPVTVDVVTTEGEQEVLKNLQRKAKAADAMFSDLIKHMNDSVSVDRSLKFTKKEEVPSWL